ncbi:hypothetical protein [Devosia sp. 2618]|uniref:hypothetical protein n=1 Tax=Devosia sp. 2618 TaxID=3156454 RepID=UPI00339317AD
MEFKVTSARYDVDLKQLIYTASGTSCGGRFTVSSQVKCLKPPGTPERTHLVVLLALTEHFRMRSASGRTWNN